MVLKFSSSRLAFKYLRVIEAGRRGSVASDRAAFGVSKARCRRSGTVVGGTSSVTRCNGWFARSRPRTPQRDNSATINRMFWDDVRDVLVVFRPGRRCDPGTIESASGRPSVGKAVDNVRTRSPCPVNGTVVDVSDCEKPYEHVKRWSSFEKSNKCV